MIFSLKITAIKLAVDEKKLELSHQKKTYTKLQKYAGSFLDQKLIPLHTYDLLNGRQILDMLPFRLLDEEVPSVILTELTSDYDGISYFPPHVDIKRRSALNYYFNTLGESTIFYKWDQINKTLNEIESFVVNDKELWALDVSKPHSVKFQRPSSRRFLSFSFSKLSYRDLIEILH